jgi:hypothetical protein
MHHLTMPIPPPSSSVAVQGLSVIPIVTKADLPHAQPEDTVLQMAASLDVSDPDDVIVTSAKSGLGIQHVLPVCPPHTFFGPFLDYGSSNPGLTRRSAPPLGG